MSLQAWLQERQYDTPYHWNLRPNEEREYPLRTETVLALANPDRHTRLLDIGCGDGRFTADATRVASVVATDVSQRALGHAKSLVRDARFVASGGATLPFHDDSFDVVTLLDVIEHVPDEEERHVIAETRRVLRPGGRLVISTNTDRAACELKHYRHYSLRRFRSLFDGMRRLELRGLIPYLPTLRVWMATPVVWRLVESRIRVCSPELAQVIVGAAIEP